MKSSLRFAALCVAAAAMTACASVEKFMQTNGAVAEVVVQEATMRVIESHPAGDRAAVAAKVNGIVASIQGANMQSVTVASLAAVAKAKLVDLNLQPSDAILANAVVDAAAEALQAKVGAGVIPADQLYYLNVVLGWVTSATAYYKA